MKKVLFIAYLYPPIFNSGTRRSLEFVNHLPDHGWVPIVLTLDNPEPQHCDPSLLAEVRPGTRVERVPMWTEQFSKKLGSLFPLGISKKIENALTWRIRRIWNIPDDTAAWAPLAIERAVQLHREEKFDMIYATGWPWTSFLIAEKVSRLTSVPYVIDYRDLWKPSDAAWDSATWLQRRLGLILERRVLRRAAGVIATTKSFLSLLPQEVLPAKRFAITNGFSEKDFSGAVRLPKESKHVTIVYTGVWRPGYGPEDLYEAMRMLKTQGYQELSRIRVVTAGFPPGKAAEFGIADFVEERGRVTHAEAISLMANADVLYLPVSKGLYEYASIPGKLFEYLGSNRPVLASTLPQSEVAAALDKVGGALRIDPGDIEGLAGILKKLCAQKDPDIFTKRCSNELSKYSRYNLAGQLSLAFDDAMSSSSYSARSGSPQHEVI